LDGVGLLMKKGDGLVGNVDGDLVSGKVFLSRAELVGVGCESCVFKLNGQCFRGFKGDEWKNDLIISSSLFLFFYYITFFITALCHFFLLHFSYLLLLLV